MFPFGPTRTVCVQQLQVQTSTPPASTRIGSSVSRAEQRGQSGIVVTLVSLESAAAAEIATLAQA